MLKQQLKEEGNEPVTHCHGLKMLAPDGKMIMSDGTDNEKHKELGNKVSKGLLAANNKNARI